MDNKCVVPNGSINKWINLMAGNKLVSKSFSQKKCGNILWHSLETEIFQHLRNKILNQNSKFQGGV